jgi:acetyltransferase-like isoleucine patch superfamily enzyme
MVFWAGQKRATKDELEHLERVKQLPCCLCLPGEQTSITEGHHCKIGNKRISHYHVLPYCRDVHHKNAHLYTRDERANLELVNETLGVNHPWPNTRIVARGGYGDT